MDCGILMFAILIYFANIHMRKFISAFWKFNARQKILHQNNFLLFQLFKIASKVASVVWKRCNKADNNFPESIYGVYLKSRKSDATFNFGLNGDYGTFLSDEIEGISKETIFLDIGANIGLFSLLASKNTFVQNIYAFEPETSTLPYLRENVRINKSAGITVFPYALAIEEGKHELYVKEGHSGASSMVPNDRTNISYEIISVNEKFLDKNLLIDATSDIFVKIDVEGYEANVLVALQKWIGFQSVSKIFLEFDVYMSNEKDLRNILIKAGFRSLRKVGNASHWDELFIRNS